jgi:hypothetical protein
MNEKSSFPPLHPILGSFAHHAIRMIGPLLSPDLYPGTIEHTLREHRNNPNVPYLRHAPSLSAIARDSLGHRSLLGFTEFREKRRTCTSLAEEELQLCTSAADDWELVEVEPAENCK